MVGIVIVVGIVAVAVAVAAVAVGGVARGRVQACGEEIGDGVRARVVCHVAAAIVVAVAMPAAAGRAPLLRRPVAIPGAAGRDARVVVGPAPTTVMFIPERYSPANRLANRLLVAFVAHARGHAEQVVGEKVGEVIPSCGARRHRRPPATSHAPTAPAHAPSFVGGALLC